MPRTASPTRRARGDVVGGRDRVASGDPNLATRGRRTESPAGKGLVRHSEGSLLAGLSWSATADEEPKTSRVRPSGMDLRQTFNHSHLTPAQGGVCPTVVDRKTGRRPSPEKHRHDRQRLHTKTLGLHAKRWDSSMRATACTVIPDRAGEKPRGKSRTHSPQKGSVLNVEKNALSHDVDSRKRGRGYGLQGTGSVGVPTAGLTSSQLFPKGEYDESPPRARKGRSMSPMKVPTQVELAMHFPAENTTRAKQQWIASQTRAHLMGPAGAPSHAAPGVGPRRAMDGTEARAQSPKFVSTWKAPPKASVPHSPSKRLSITGSPRRGFYMHSTARLLAWD